MLCTLLSDVLAALSGTKGVRGLTAACIIIRMTAELSWTLFTTVGFVTEALCWPKTATSGSCCAIAGPCVAAAEGKEPVVAAGDEMRLLSARVTASGMLESESSSVHAWIATVSPACTLHPSWLIPLNYTERTTHVKAQKTISKPHAQRTKTEDIRGLLICTTCTNLRFSKGSD